MSPIAVLQCGEALERLVLRLDVNSVVAVLTFQMFVWL